MAQRNTWLLHLEIDGWRLFGSAEDGEPSAEESTFQPSDLPGQPKLVVEALKEAGWRGEPIVVGLAHGWLLHATIDVPSPQVFRKPQVLRYHFEESIPWSAEEFVADCVPHGRRALVFAARHEVLSEFLLGLAEHGCIVAAVTPTPLLALQGHLASGNSATSGTLLWQHDDAVDLWVIRADSPLGWNCVRDDPQDVRQSLGAQLLLEGESEVLVGGLSAELRDALAEVVTFSEAELPSYTDAAHQAASAIVAGRAEPWVNLLGDELAAGSTFNPVRKETRWLVVAAMVSAVIVGTSWLQQANRYLTGASGLTSDTESIYSELHPDKPVPPRLLAALREQQRTLKGTRNVDETMPNRVAADETLQRFLHGVPDGMRMRLLEIRVEGGKVYATGEVRSNADADRLAESVRGAGFRVDAPRTQRLADKGYGVRINSEILEGATASRNKEGGRR